MIIKPSFDEFIKSCTPLYKIPELETKIRKRVQGIVAELLGFSAEKDPVKNLLQFIKKDIDFLGVLLAITNLLMGAEYCAHSLRRTGLRTCPCEYSNS